MEKKIFDTYGINSDSLAEAKCMVENALNLSLESHESSYWGGEYFRAIAEKDEEFQLIANWDDSEKEWISPKFQEYPFILFVNRTQRSRALKQLLEATKRAQCVEHKEL